jgi:hypothetical protein
LANRTRSRHEHDFADVASTFNASMGGCGLLKWMHRIDARAEIAAATDINRGGQSFN